MSARIPLRRAVLLGAAFLLAAVAVSDGVVQAGEHGKGGATLTGTWFIATPDGRTTFYNFHDGGTLSGIVSNAGGGPPFPQAGPARESGDQGIWRRSGHRFEAVVWRFAYDFASGEARSIVRIRLVGTLDRRFKKGSGDYSVTVWNCPAFGLECPDPGLVEPTQPEFSFPGFTFTMTRQHLH
jgi:hypothetical protein